MSDPRFAKRKRMLRQRIEGAPDDWEALFDLGQTCMDDHDPTEALRWFREAIRLSPNQPRVANALADASFDLAMYEDAITWYRQATKLNQILTRPFIFKPIVHRK